MSVRRLFEWSLVTGCAAVVLWGADAKPTTVQGVLIDKECSARAETRLVSGSNPHL